MSSMIEFLSYEFIRNALIAGILASVLCAVLGTFIIVKRLVFISGGISHSAFGGLGVFYYLGLNPLIGAFVAAGLVALIIGLLNPRKIMTQDALIGALWAFGMAIGIVFIAMSPGYAPNLMTYMFGNILAVNTSDLYLIVIITFTVLVTVILLYKEFIAIAFDEEFAFIQGVPVRLLMIIFLLLIGFSIVLLIRLVGYPGYRPVDNSTPDRNADFPPFHNNNIIFHYCEYYYYNQRLGHIIHV